jgi:hypothetical protein
MTVVNSSTANAPYTVLSTSAKSSSNSNNGYPSVAQVVSSLHLKYLTYFLTLTIVGLWSYSDEQSVEFRRRCIPASAVAIRIGLLKQLPAALREHPEQNAGGLLLVQHP